MDIDDSRLLHRRELLTAGFADDELRQRLRSGALVSVRRGSYIAPAALPSTPEGRHAVLVRAAVRGLAAGSVVSHVSAVVLHGLPVWGVDLGRVHITRNRRSGARVGADLHVHAAPLDPAEIGMIGGVLVTLAARAVLDVLRVVPFEQGVVVADAALATGVVTAQQLDDAAAAAAGRPGMPRARRVLAFADAGGRSVGESRSRVAMLRMGIPTPRLQWEVRAAAGHRIGFADFGWPEFGTVGEFDGAVKYGRLLRPGQQPGDAVFAEKLREDAMRDEDLRMVRWTWSDLHAFNGVARRLRRAFDAT